MCPHSRQALKQRLVELAALDASRVHKDCVLKVLRGSSGAAPHYLGVRPGEQAVS